jgi:hypothetical protein
MPNAVQSEIAVNTVNLKLLTSNILLLWLTKFLVVVVKEDYS